MINGYQLLKERCRVGKIVIFDALDESGKPVLIQKTQEDFPSLDDLVDLKNDFEISRNLAIPGVLQSTALVKSSTDIALVKTFFEGIPLGQYLQKRQLPVVEALKVSASIADVLHQIHSRRIIHKDIHPDNFLIAPGSLELRLCTFSLATQLSKEAPGAAQSEKLKGSLPYISPEQTGRMNRSIDYRTDFYALGAMMYQMLCGRPPFVYASPMELVHAHIAKKPEEPHRLAPGIPSALSGIVMKLLSKNAEERYQNARNLGDDLRQALHLFEEFGHLDAFVFGDKDRSASFRISEKLYGREKELSQLMDAFEKVRLGPISMVLVGGYSGLGKTRLIHEIHKPIARENGYFTSGKFDQYNRNIPYSAVGSAFGTLIRQFLAESPDELLQWKQKITAALDDNGEVLIDVIPELELLIGKQAPVLKLGLNESQNRFFQVFTDFVKVLASPQRPVVIFIDDLQWADSGSLDLFRHLMLDQSVQHTLIIGAYRDNEVSASHPLMLMAHTLTKKHRNVTTIALSELSDSQVNHLIADSLHQSPDDTRELTRLVMNKTRGNPFFINQFLQKLVEEKLIYFDEATARWTWNEGAIADMDIADNVVDLLVQKIQTLSLQTQKTLRLASCIGNRFDLHTLALIAEKGESEVSAELWEAVHDELLSPVGQRSRHFNDSLWSELGVRRNGASNAQFMFQHDRIQQAAATLIAEEEKKKTHVQIGRLLLQKLSPAEVQDDIFNIVSHFSEAPELIADKEERRRIALLNFTAGERAKNANSYQPAASYFHTGLTLIDPEDTEVPYNDFLLSCSECEYLCGHYEASEKMFDEAIAKAGTNLARAEVLSRKMQLYENTARPLDAIRIALEGLRLLGTRLPEKPGQVRILRELLLAKYNLRGKSFEDLENNPDLTSPELILTMKILMNLWGPGYLHNQNLLALAILRMVILSARYGNSPESALAYAFYGFVLSAQLKDYKNGDAFGRLGMRLNEKFDDKVLRSKVYNVYSGCIEHWNADFSVSIPTLNKAYQIGIEANDLLYASYATSFLTRNQYAEGEPLDTLYEKVKLYIHFCKNVQNYTSLYHQRTIAYFLCMFMELQPEESVFADMIGSEAVKKKVDDYAANEGIPLPKAWYNYYNTEWSVRIDAFEEALDWYKQAKQVIHGLLGFAEVEFLNFYQSLALLALHPTNPQHATDKVMRIVRANQKSLRKVAELSPNNFKAKYLLIEAEKAAVLKRFKKATVLYREAKKYAQKSGILQDMGLVSERAADFYRINDMPELCQILYREAWYHYNQWGAKAKVRQLEKKLRDLGVAGWEHAQTRGNNQSGSLISTSSSLDLQSIFQASTTISGEVDFEKLLEKLMKIVLENAGAESGCLLLVEDDKLQVATSGNVKEESISLVNNLPVEKADFLSRSIVQFVYRTNETLIINDAVRDVRFARDPYLIERQPKSILCQPIIQSGECIAIIYLENNLAADAFTPARIEVLNLLSGQIAVSLENAMLYKHQHEVSDAYQRFVPEAFISALGHNNILQVKLGDSISREMTVMCCDIRSYTTIAEGMTVAENFNFINSYLMLVGPVIKKYGGFINHYLGDGIIALFKDSPEDALRAALEIMSLLHTYNEIHTDSPPISLGIGLHTGMVMMGIIGDEERRDANVLSDAVNISARLEGLTRQFGTNILIGQTTYDGIRNKQHFQFRHLGLIKLKGKGLALGVHEVVCPDDSDTQGLKQQTIPDFNAALEHYFNQNFAAAAALLEKVLKDNADDLAAQYYYGRALRYQESGAPESWDGTERISEK